MSIDQAPEHTSTGADRRVPATATAAAPDGRSGGVDWVKWAVMGLIGLFLAGVAVYIYNVRSSTEEPAPVPTTNASASAKAAEQKAYASAEKIVRAQANGTTPLTSAEATPRMVDDSTKFFKMLKDDGLTWKGAADRTVWVRPLEYRKTGAWTMSVTSCTIVNRYLTDPSGKNVSTDSVGNPVKPGRRTSWSHHFVSTDKGATWKLDTENELGAC